MKIIFDLDYTLLDTAEFKKKMAEILGENFKADYEKYFKSRGVNFNLGEYLSILKKNHRIDDETSEKMKAEIEELFLDIDDYLKFGVEKTLEHFKERGDELILMTFGYKQWQKEKIKNLSIKKYFDEIIFEDKDKSQSEYLKSLGKKNEEVLIINDNLSEAEQMLKILKKGELRLVKGPYNGEAKDRARELFEITREEREENKIKELNLR